MRRRRTIPLLAGLLVAAASGLLITQGPAIAAGAILHPARRPLAASTPTGCQDAVFAGADVVLKGWRCGSGNGRGTIVFLHGVGDNRAGVSGIVARFIRQGFDVVAYDSRAHGESGGDTCTYGFYEKADLKRVLDAIKGPVVLIGASLGAAVALQAAAEDHRVVTVVAAETFSDLESVVRDRAPFVPGALLRKAFRIAESQARFEVARVSPAEAAKRINVPILLIHGALDTDTPPDHSRRILDNLRGPKKLLLVPDARHNESLSSGAVWEEIESWVLRLVEPQDVDRLQR